MQLKTESKITKGGHTYDIALVLGKYLGKSLEE